MTDDTAWPQVGDKVAVLFRRRYTMQTVTRLTKTQIVLDDATRFQRRAGFRQVGGDEWEAAHLVNPSDPGVAERMAQQRTANILRTVALRAKALADEYETLEPDAVARRIDHLHAKLDLAYPPIVL